MTRLMMVSPYRSSLEALLENDSRFDDLTVVRSPQAFRQLASRSAQPFDFVVSSLVLSELLPTRMRGDLHLLLDGFRFVRDTLDAAPHTRIVVCSTFQHVRLVMTAYELGAKWYVHDHPGMALEVIDGILAVGQGKTLEPYGLSVSSSNRWLAAHDSALRRFSSRDIEFVEALLVDVEYSNETIARLALASRESLHFRVYKILKLGGFDDKDALVAHARTVGLRPLDQLRPDDNVIVEGAPTQMSAARRRRFDPAFKP